MKRCSLILSCALAIEGFCCLLLALRFVFPSSFTTFLRHCCYCLWKHFLVCGIDSRGRKSRLYPASPMRTIFPPPPPLPLSPPLPAPSREARTTFQAISTPLDQTPGTNPLVRAYEGAGSKNLPCVWCPSPSTNSSSFFQSVASVDLMKM